MGAEIKKSDWKLFQERVPEWQEAYMEKLEEGYVKLLKGKGNPSDKFWKLEKKIKTDRKHIGVVIEMSKSDMLYDLLKMLREKVITTDDLEDFSDELKEQVKLMQERGNA